jgi:ferritin-like metal-binding protein YciE
MSASQWAQRLILDTGIRGYSRRTCLEHSAANLRNSPASNREAKPAAQIAGIAQPEVSIVAIQRRGKTMKLFSANIEDLRSLYVMELRKALDMEQKITKSLPRIIANCTDQELSSALENHLSETEQHVVKVERLLHTNEQDVSTETCKAIAGLAAEAEDSIKDATDASIRDIVIIECAQAVEHHEIAVYGTLRRWAELLGLDEDANVLESIEADEIKADETLTAISDTVNVQAAA